VSEYVTAVIVALDGFMNETEIAARMGRAKSNVPAWKKGHISREMLERFHFFIRSHAPQVPFPDPPKHALIETIKYFRTLDEELTPREQFDFEEFECLEVAFGNFQWQRTVNENDQVQLKRLAGMVLEEVHRRVGTRRVNALSDLQQVIS